MNNRTKSHSIEDTLYTTGWCLIGIAVLYTLFVILTGFDIRKYMLPCILHTFTGLYCPGCGGTRAVSYLLHADFIRSLICHPFVLYAALICGWFMLSQTIERISSHRVRIGMRYHDFYLWIAIALVFLNCIVKNALLLIWGIDLLRFAA